MKKTMEFLGGLRQNNNREWFEAHRERYTEALAEFNDFAERLIEAVSGIDPSVTGLTLRDCTYRIYRDTRFSADKTPYKTHMGVYICPHGKKSGYAGYYFHLEPASEGFAGNSLLATGLYRPMPDVLKSVRDEIFDNGKQVADAVRHAEGFALDRQSALQRPPKGYPADHPYMDLLKLREFSLVRPIDESFILAPDLPVRVAEAFRPTVKLNAILNRAVAFALENR